MKTKLFTLLFMLIASAGTIFAESGTCGENLTWDLTDGVLTISGTGEMDNYPESFENVGPWYAQVENIISVIIKNGVTSIGDYAFCYCKNLTSVEIPNSVTSIGGRAFYSCSSLTSVEIPNSVTSIGGGAFYDCVGLTSVTVNSNSVMSQTSIDGIKMIDIFGYDVPKYIIGDNVTSIGDYAFKDCYRLTSIEIPNSVINIGEGVFYGCSGLTSPVYNAHVFAYLPPSYSGLYSIPDGIKSIAACAFLFCDGLTSVEIPNSVTSIGGGAFYDCDGLTSVTIGNSVTSIGERAFYYCKNLISVTIPNSVTSIGDDAFSLCEGLTSVSCYCTTPPTMGRANKNVFYGVDKSIPLYVPAGSINAYKSADQWNEFTNILPITAKETETTDVKTTSIENSVDVTWPAVNGAYTYELVIRDKNGNVVCTLIFNAQGQLMSITFNAPSRDGAPQQTQSAGFAFTVTGLDSGTEYDLTITAKDENGREIDKKNMSFQTDGTQGFEDINTNIKSHKLLRNGQILILRGDRTYTLQGIEVK